MIDQETKSLWSHILGEAKQGELTGTLLETLPAQMTDWQSWRQAHPETTVLDMSRTAEDYEVDFYRQPELFVIGMINAGNAKAWPFDQLGDSQVVNDMFRNQPLLIVFDNSSSGAMIYSRNVSGRVLEFDMQTDQLVDLQTGTIWDPTSGRAVEGELAGTLLKPEVGIVSYRSTWQTFHPESKYWSRDE